MTTHRRDGQLRMLCSAMAHFHNAPVPSTFNLFSRDSTSSRFSPVSLQRFEPDVQTTLYWGRLSEGLTALTCEKRPKILLPTIFPFPSSSGPRRTIFSAAFTQIWNSLSDLSIEEKGMSLA